MKIPDKHLLHIIDFAENGYGIGKNEYGVFFVEHAVPGDKCEVELIKRKKNYHLARIIHFQNLSANRTSAPCKYFKYCGGCKLQHTEYKYQLEWKQKRIVDVFQRIGKLDSFEIKPIEQSEKIFHYRNKMDYSFSSVRWLTPEEVKSNHVLNKSNALGFHRPLQFDKVLDIHDCFLQIEPANEIRNFIRNFFITKNIPFFDIRQKTGGPRSLILRNNRKGDFYVILSVYDYNELIVQELCQLLVQKFSVIKSFWVYHNTKGNDSLLDLKPVYHYGMNYLEEDLCGMKFKFGPLSFFQVNVDVAEKIFLTAKEKSEYLNGGIVWDLYCGVGVIGLLLAEKAKRVIGIEILDEAVCYANENAKINNIKNAFFYSGDVKKIIHKENLLSLGKPDVVICDPPRAGIDKKILNFLLSVEPNEILYISCNPATQARDIGILSEKYHPTFIKPYDMFPQTSHIENLCVLKHNTK